MMILTCLQHQLPQTMEVFQLDQIETNLKEVDILMEMEKEDSNLGAQRVNRSTMPLCLLIHHSLPLWEIYLIMSPSMIWRHSSELKLKYATSLYINTDSIIDQKC